MRRRRRFECFDATLRCRVLRLGKRLSNCWIAGDDSVDGQRFDQLVCFRTDWRWPRRVAPFPPAVQLFTDRGQFGMRHTEIPISLRAEDDPITPHPADEAIL